MIRVYGIRQCDTLKKALRWLDAQQIPYVYHDYRKDGLSRALLQEFVDALGWEALFNKRGTTYRQLDEATQQALDAQLAFELMLAQPAIIKRPLLLKDGQYTLGFTEAQYHSLFA